uniref:Uncharacterized protein n=1 Tax=Arundo donax TaxID=35708 RepID=A0A0A9EY85_ARUDO
MLLRLHCCLGGN